MINASRNIQGRELLGKLAGIFGTNGQGYMVLIGSVHERWIGFLNNDNLVLNLRHGRRQVRSWRYRLFKIYPFFTILTGTPSKCLGNRSRKTSIRTLLNPASQSIPKTSPPEPIRNNRWGFESLPSGRSRRSATVYTLGIGASAR